MTHCNAGGLATADYGTALGVLFEAKKQGKCIKVFVDDRPALLQGARLTAWELMREGIDTTLICDNCGRISWRRVVSTQVFGSGPTGSPRMEMLQIRLGLIIWPCEISRNTFLCRRASFDLRSQYPYRQGYSDIEERDGDEVRKLCGKLIAPKNRKCISRVRHYAECTYNSDSDREGDIQNAIFRHCEAQSAEAI